ncbi:MAG: class I SAM-dependent methyltransferase [Solirubrobacteraceae bacterium]
MNSDLASTTPGVSNSALPEHCVGRLIEVERLVRYSWAAQAASGHLVLDAGCGSGYGSRLLAEGGAREVIGVDLARAVLQVATPAMPEQVRLVPGNLRQLEFEEDKFELVVCFEVIEYVEDPLVVLDELIRVLAPGGLLLVSSPDRDAYQPGNPYQPNQFAPAELEKALAARLSRVQLLRQRDYVASALMSSDSPSGGDLVVEDLAPDTSGDEIYTIAMASDAELPAMRDLAFMGGSASLSQWLALLETHGVQIAEKDNEIYDLQARLEERDRLAELLAEAEGRAAELPELKLRIADLELELEDARSAAAAARQEADQLDRMLMYGRRMLWFVRPLITPLRRLRHKLRG